jgi:Ribonuclease G/E
MYCTTFDKYGNLFLKQGREYFIKKCAILCVIRLKFRSSDQKKNISFVRFGRNGKHAEEIAIRRIEKEENGGEW